MLGRRGGKIIRIIKDTVIVNKQKKNMYFEEK